MLRSTTPLLSLILEVADEFCFLSVNADDGLCHINESSRLAANESHLSISVGRRRTGESFAITLERKLSQMKHSPDGSAIDSDSSSDISDTQPNEFAFACW
jgi:hypothetical protein